MKKTLLSAVAISVALSSFAQKANLRSIAKEKTQTIAPAAAARTTTVGDTIEMYHIYSTDTIVTYYAVNSDSGYVAGTNAFGDKGFAERYAYPDTLVSVLGVVTKFTGTVNPATTKSVIFNVWSAGAQVLNSNYGSGHVYNSGFPNASLASLTVPITMLGIGTTATAPDTQKVYAFPTPTAYIHPFFVGYTIAYTPTAMGGDTISLVTSKNGERHYSTAYVSGADTIINDVNATMYSNGTWHDNALENFGVKNHLYIFPLVKIGGSDGVNGFTKNNLTFYNNYPNPATISTNIKFTLAQSTEVTISVTDMTGKTVYNTSAQYNAGTQVVAINTASMPAGEYIYLVRTAEGDGAAGKMSVIK